MEYNGDRYHKNLHGSNDENVEAIPASKGLEAVPGKDPLAELKYTEDRISGKDAGQEKVPEGTSSTGEVNMEASITSDDVVRAGGFGARDDISSVLPVASDSTDFEASLLGARDYEEEPHCEPKRPGLGWTDASVPK